MIKLTLNEYEKWVNNKNINPKTNRQIKITSKIYKYYESININNLYIMETVDSSDPISLIDFWTEENGIRKIVYKNINNLVFYIDSSKKIRCFEKESLSYILGYGKKIHPITGENIPENVFENIVPLKIIEDQDKTIENITFDVFQLFNNSSIFIDHQLFLNLNKEQLLKLYYEMKEFYNNNIPIDQIINNVFNLQKKDLIKKNIDEIRKYILNNMKILLECNINKYMIINILVGGLSIVINEIKELYPDLSFDF